MGVDFRLMFVVTTTMAMIIVIIIFLIIAFFMMLFLMVLIIARFSFYIDPPLSFNIIGTTRIHINVYSRRGWEVAIDLDIYAGRRR